MSADELDVLNGPVAADGGRHANFAGDARPARFLGIDRFRAADQVQIVPQSDASAGRRLRWWSRGRLRGGEITDQRHGALDVRIVWRQLSGSRGKLARKI